LQQNSVSWTFYPVVAQRIDDFRMLSFGGEAATSRDITNSKQPITDVPLVDSPKQFYELAASKLLL